MYSGGPAGLTCSGVDGGLVGLVSTVDLDQHLVRSTRSEALKRALLTVGLDALFLMQLVITIIQKNFIQLKVSLWWRPVEGQAGGGVCSDGQIGDHRWVYRKRDKETFNFYLNFINHTV